MGALIYRNRKKIFVGLRRFADRPRVLYTSVVLYEVYENITYVLSNTGKFQDSSPPRRKCCNSYKTRVHSHAHVCSLSCKIKDEELKGHRKLTMLRNKFKPIVML